MGCGRPRRWARGLWNKYNKGLVNCLASRVERIERLGKKLLGPERPGWPLVARRDVEVQVRRVEVPPDGVGIFSQDKVS